MKKTWNRLILVSFILLALAAAAAVAYLLPYYREYKVFDGIEAGQWSNVQKSYGQLDSRRQQEVQALLPAYAKHICIEYQQGKKDYIYTVAAYDAINSIDETKDICTKYNALVNRTEYRNAIEDIYNANQNYNSQGVTEANDTINNINMRLDADTRKEVVTEVLTEKYEQYLAQEITAETMNSYVSIINGLASADITDYAAIVSANVSVVEQYRQLFDTAQTAYESGDYLTAINICTSVQLDPMDTAYQDKYYSLYQLAYSTGRNEYDTLLDNYIEIGDNENALALLEKLEKYYSGDMDFSKYRLAMASDWQQAYVSLAANADAEIQAALAKSESGTQVLEDRYQDITPDSMLLYDIDDDGIPEAFFFSSTEGNDTYVSCFIYTYREESAQFVGYARVRSFCSDSAFVAFPWNSSRTSGDEYCLKRYSGGTLTDGPYVQKVDGVYYVNEQETDETEYLSEQSATLATSLEQGVTDFEWTALTDSESYILAFQDN